MQKSMEIKITIILNKEEYFICVQNIPECSEVEAITSAMFQLAGFYEHCYCIDKDSVKWKVQFEDIYKLSSEDISITENGYDLDYMDIIIYTIYAIIRSVYSTDDINNGSRAFNIGPDIMSSYSIYKARRDDFMKQLFSGNYKKETCELPQFSAYTIHDDLLNKKLFADLDSKANDRKLYDKIVRTLYNSLRETIESRERRNK